MFVLECLGNKSSDGDRVDSEEETVVDDGEKNSM